MTTKKRVRRDKYLIFRFPVFPDSGLNKDLSYVQGSREYLELSDQVCSSSNQDKCSLYFHGIIPERVFSIMAEVE